MFVLPRTDGNVAYLGRAILIYPFTWSDLKHRLTRGCQVPLHGPFSLRPKQAKSKPLPCSRAPAVRSSVGIVPAGRQLCCCRASFLHLLANTLFSFSGSQSSSCDLKGDHSSWYRVISQIILYFRVRSTELLLHLSFLLIYWCSATRTSQHIFRLFSDGLFQIQHQ